MFWRQLRERVKRRNKEKNYEKWNVWVVYMCMPRMTDSVHENIFVSSHDFMKELKFHSRQ